MSSKKDFAAAAFLSAANPAGKQDGSRNKEQTPAAASEAVGL